MEREGAAGEKSSSPQPLDISTPSIPQDADEAVPRVNELSDRLIELTGKNGISWLAACEKPST
jgi:hypothetical protein